jgi:hypothetical protein
MKFIKRKNIDTYKPKSQRFSVEVDGRAIIDTNKTLTVPIGNTAERPNTGVPGMIRYNNDVGFNDFEVFTAYSNWGWEKIRTNRPSDITFATVGTGSGDGTVDSILITLAGAGYDSLNPPTVTISDPDIGSDVATVGAITIVGGTITEILIDNPGSGYVTVPQVTIQAPPGTGFGFEQATATVILTGDLEYPLPVIPVNSLGQVSDTNIQVYVENVFQLPGINYTVTLLGNQSYVRFDAPVPLGKPVYVIYGFDR